MVVAPRDRVETALLAAAGTPAARLAGARPIAVGWATVELDRAAAELAEAFGLDVGVFRPVARSMALGSSCLTARGVLADGGSLTLLEPDTEGRLAASLARLGEGPVVAWLQTGEMAAAMVALRVAGFTMSTQREGPFGPERLIVDGAIYGPHSLLVSRSTGTIRA